MQTEECRVAVKRLLAYLEDPAAHRDEIDAAIVHIKQCPYCGGRMEHLVRAVTADEVDSLTCQECQDRLPDYLEAKEQAQSHETRWHPVAFHLETCPHCSAEYEILSGLTALAYGEQGTDPPHYPVPDLSFLRKERDTSSWSPQVSWRLDELGRLIVEFSAELMRALQQAAPQPAYAAARLKTDRTRRILCQLALKEAVEDLEVTITAEERRDDPSHCTVIVEVDIPSRGGWPHLADTEVTLKQDGVELEMQLTDAFGRAAFEGIPTDDLDRLVFEISPRA